MDTTKPLSVPVLHLLGAVGAGVAGFRIGSYIGKSTERNTPDGIRDTATLLRRKNPRHPEQIDDFVLGLMALARKESPKASIFVRREAIATHLEVPEHFVSQAFERLNKLGVVGPESNTVNGDDVWRGVDRSRMGPGKNQGSGWNGSIRYVNLENLDAYLAQMNPEARPAEDAAAAESDVAAPNRRRMKP